MQGIIKQYFQSWLDKNSSNLQDFFDDDAVYSECYGPKYIGLNQILHWFNDWNKQGHVLKWEITQFIEQKNICVVEWYFSCEYKKERSEFNGVSIVEFGDNHKIVGLKEFKSQKEHTYPYGRL